MGKIISFFALFLFLTSCSKEENFKKETELSKKEQIVDILVSNGIEQKDISFVNFKENDNVLTFATIEEFKEFVQEGKMVAKLKNRYFGWSK